MFGFLNKRRSGKTVTAKRSPAAGKLRRHRRLSIDSLEDRRLLATAASMSMSGTVLNIKGGTGNDTVQVSGTTAKVTVTLNGKSQNFTNVEAMTFYGGDGNDSFKNLTSIFAGVHGENGNDTLIGGPGNEILEGGPGTDRLEGGGGNDSYKFKGSTLGTDTIVDTSGIDSIDLEDRGGSNTLDIGKTGTQVVAANNLSINLQSGSAIENVYGSAYNDIIYGNTLDNKLYGEGGHDRLYGRGGNDRLEGNEGNDAMFGGAGSDTLVGGTGEDRYLMQSGDTASGYSSGTDAKITFTNGKSNWTDAEIEVVDQTFAKLYDRVGTQGLMRDPTYGPEMTFKKDILEDDVVGRNSVKDGVRTIYIDEWTETNATANANAIDVVIHELGHNWDAETEDLGFFADFKKISGWTTTKPSTGSYTKAAEGNWYFLSSAKFAREYGKNSPFDDWSTVWETYFRDGGYKSTSPIASKLKIVDNFMNWAKAGMPLGF